MNGSRTHIIESYPFERDFLIDLPLHLGGDEVFQRNAILRELIPAWQTDVPVHALEGSAWRRPGIFYVQVGMQDSLGASLPPGSVASVGPISQEERLHPDPRGIYLLQFGNGYRCCSCTVSRGRLFLMPSDKSYTGPLEFRYPGMVLIAGRIRMFAAEYPVPTDASLKTLPSSRNPAPLLLPWHQPSVGHLWRAEQRRLRRPRSESQWADQLLETVFQMPLSGRTKSRYLGRTHSRPHVNLVLHMSLRSAIRYTDSLRAMHALPSDRHRYSMETYLSVNHLSDLAHRFNRARMPQPEQRWADLREEWREWPTLLSMKFPRLRSLENRILRLHQSHVFNGLDPLFSEGSLLLLQTMDGVPDTDNDHHLTDWNRPIYSLRTRSQILCGYLAVEDSRYTLVPHPRRKSAIHTFHRSEITEISKVIGVALPV